MKTPIAVALALTLFAGSASAMYSKNVVDEVNSANSYGTVVVHLDGSTATLTGSVGNKLEANIVAQAALGSDGIDKVINMISTNH